MEQLPTVLTIRRAAMAELPERFAGDDVRFAPEFARLMIERFTHPGECVLDPFAGYGTTLSAARELGLECVGVELLPQRVEYMRAQLDPHACVYVTMHGVCANLRCPASTLCSRRHRTWRATIIPSIRLPAMR